MTAEEGSPDLSLPYLTATHRDFRLRIRARLQQIVLPRAEVWETQGYISRDGWKELGTHGLLELAHSGEDFLYSAIFLEELGNLGYAGLRAAIAVHAYMASSYLRLFGTPEQQTYLRDVHCGERVAALAITEPEAGSDLSQLCTYAQRQRDGAYRVNGTKCYVTNGSRAGFIVLLAKLDEGTSIRGLSRAGLLIVDADSPGITRTPSPMLGWRGADVCTIELKNVLVPAGNLLGDDRKTFLYLMRALDFERMIAGILAVGGALNCVDLLRRFVEWRRLKNAPLDANQVIRHRLAELSSDLSLVRLYAYHAAWMHSQAILDTRTAAVLKLKATEFAIEAAQACLHYHGAQGYMNGASAARLYRDATAGAIAGGPSELMRELVYEAEG